MRTVRTADRILGTLGRALGTLCAAPIATRSPAQVPGIFGSTFFMLTGFHGFHVFLGGLMLTVVLIRMMRGHFTAENHFAFEGAAWYWHFVDVVWLLLYIIVYWL